MKTDTIAAIATALTDSGIGIIRVSGPSALEVAGKIYRSPGGRKSPGDYAPNTIHYGFIYDGEELIDEVMISVMRAPKSYTAEDTVEINCHGGVFLMRRILEAVLKNGARLAQPGEFTKRAFLNGRIDLAEAEAVMDMIRSENEMSLKASVSQLRGFLSEEVKKLRDDIIYETAFIESALDDPEHISLEGYYDKLIPKLINIINRIQKLFSSADNGRILKEGIKTVIVGKPNAGKSSLLNILAGEERAIVTEIAGTTRDILEENIRLDGMSLNVIDTAGIRSTEDIVEKMGVDKAKRYAGDADLILYVVDASAPFDDDDEQILVLIKDKKVIVLLNKTDLPPVVTEDMIYEKVEAFSPQRDNKVKIIKTSVKENKGLDEFALALKEMFYQGEISPDAEAVITNIRHKEALQDAYDSLRLVEKSIQDQMPEDFLSIDLTNAYKSLGYIVGEEMGDDLVNEIFSKFCMGK